MKTTLKIMATCIFGFVGSYVLQAHNIYTPSGTVGTSTSATNIGIGINNPSALLQVQNGSFLSNGTTGATPVSGGGTRLIWVPEKSSLRAGAVGSTQWDAANIGDYSTAFGQDCIASGDWSFAGGWDSDATSTMTFAFGGQASATGSGAIAIGDLASASGANSVSIGSGTEAKNFFAQAYGVNTKATAAVSFAIGSGVSSGSKMVNNKSNSLAIGFNSTIPTFFVGGASGVGTIGKVGIGTKGPSETLDINGSVRIRTVNNDDTLSRILAINSTGVVHYRLANWTVSGSNIYNANVGNVGIGTTTPAATLDIVGTGLINAMAITSDSRYKKNIETVSSAMDKVRALRGASYEFNNKNDHRTNFPEGRTYGFVAQELQEVLPELVIADKEGYLAVNYDGVIPVLVEALKEMESRLLDQAELEERIKRLEELLSSNQQNQGATASTLSTDGKAGDKPVSLGQNSPNPFSGETTIEYYLPEDVRHASFAIYDQSGKVILTQELNKRGVQHLKVSEGHLKKGGQYHYSLLINGIPMVTKSMIMNR